jgi:LacI family transcriptional regulator
MSVTLSDIAKIVGVSPNTVSRALRGKNDISQETASKITKVANMTGYRPNSAGRALRYSSFRSIGVLAGGAGFYLPQQTLGAMSQTMANKGYSCSLVCTDKFDAEHIAEIPPLKSRLVDSLIISYVNDLPPKTVDAISQAGAPVIWLNRWLDHDCLTVDEGGAVIQLMEHFAECGFEDTMYIDYTTGGGGWVNVRRLQAFDIAGERYGIKTLRFAHRVVPREDRFSVTLSWLNKPNRPRSVIVSSYTAAQAVMQTALYLGLRIPEDIAIASFDDCNICTSCIPTLTCAMRPEHEFGVIAAEMALQKAKNPSVELPSRSVKYGLSIGGSTVAEKSCIYTVDGQNAAGTELTQTK